MMAKSRPASRPRAADTCRASTPGIGGDVNHRLSPVSLIDHPNHRAVDIHGVDAKRAETLHLPRIRKC
jgi:hypothetical protein